MRDVILELKHIDRTCIGGDDPATATVVEALRDINPEIQRGEFVSIIGSSGCGKATLLRLIGGFDQPQAGQALPNGAPSTGPAPIRSAAAWHSAWPSPGRRSTSRRCC